MNKKCLAKGKKLAVDFLSKKYNIPKSKFNIPIKIGEVEYHYPKSGSYVTVKPGCKTWPTYKLEKVGLYSDDIKVDPHIAYALQLVHELTHHVQFLQKRKLSEIETTRNEIEFVLWYQPKLIPKLKVIRRKK